MRVFRNRKYSFQFFKGGKIMWNLSRKKILSYVLLLAGLAVFIWPGLAATAQEVNDVNFAEDPNLLAEPQMPGRIEGTGTYFEVSDSNYLNITFQSSEPVHLMLESVPEMIVMHIEAAEGATSIQITLSGFLPSTTYYKYEDDYHNLITLTTDPNGSYSYTQDLTEPHLVFIQPHASTKFIPSDTSIGTWDPINRIYTLNTDVSETIQIDEDNLTLDGAGHSVITASGNGIYLSGRTGVTIKNLNIQGFSYGIRLNSSNGNTLTDNTTNLNSSNGIRLENSSSNTLIGNIVNSSSSGFYIFNSSNNNLTGNTASENSYYGIHLDYHSNNNTLKGNTTSDNYYYGIYLYRYSGGNTLTGNTSSNNIHDGIILYSSSSGNTLIGNTINSNWVYGIFLQSSSNNNQIYNNNFINNTTQACVLNSSSNVFNLAKPIGGNYWSNWCPPAHPDNDSDGFVDTQYSFEGGVDNLPLAIPYVSNQSPVANAGDNLQVLSANQPYTVIQGTAMDSDGDPLQYRWLEANDILLGWNDVGMNGEAYLDLGTLPYLAIGNHTLTLEVTDGQLTALDEMILTMENSPPEAQPAPAYQVVEIGIDPIGVVADVLDFDGDTLSYQWLKDGEVLASGTVETVQGGEVVQLPDLNIPAGDTRFPLGVHTIELKVSDGVNDPLSAYASVEVSDTTAPSLSPVPSVTILWPPNHKLQPVTIYANAFDNGGGIIHLDVTVISSEPPDDAGDGSTIPDYYIDSIDDETGIIELRLRSERSGKGDGRTYTITITATDESGNQSTATVEVLAPHDRRKK
jgi:parallel beta-helix repeat protein